MKKIIICAVMALMSLTASAQQGEINAGANLNYSKELASFGVGLKGQYNLTDNWRAEGAVNIYFDDPTTWDLSVNMHYLIPTKSDIRFYPLVGATLFDSDKLKLGLNIGVGADYPIYKDLRAFVEYKYQLLQDFNHQLFAAGVAYTF